MAGPAFPGGRGIVAPGAAAPAAVDIAVGSRIRVDKAATRCSWADAKTWKINWSTPSLEVTMVDGKERYRVKYDDDGTTVEETLRAPFYELIDASPRRLDDLNYADTLALAARSRRECPSARLREPPRAHAQQVPRDVPRAGRGRRQFARAASRRAYLSSAGGPSCEATLGREPGADRTLLNFVRAGVLPSDGRALDQLADRAARDAVLATDPTATWDKLVVRQNIAERTSLFDRPWMSFGGDYASGATRPTTPRPTSQSLRWRRATTRSGD